MTQQPGEGGDGRATSAKCW